MLTDPLSVTYNGSAKTLPQVTGKTDGLDQAKLIHSRKYATADGEFSVDTRQSILKDGTRKAEVFLTRKAAETDANTVAQGYFNNSVGLTFIVNSFGANASVDIPLIRAALLSLVDTTLQGRLIGGES
jgi:hypothetical protein